jgi:hypothetical protein
MDKNKTLNAEFNEVYEAISKAYDAINEFYMKNFWAAQNDDDSYARYRTMHLLEKMEDCKDIAHDIAEHFTWDR